VNSNTSFASLTLDEQIESLGGCVRAIMSQFDFEVASFESINHEFNSTFKITTEGGDRFALRINVNSTKTLENLRAEVQWVQGIREILVPAPIANSAGEFITFAHHDASGRTLPAVLFSWLEGEEVGDEPTADQLFAAGAAMAKLHISSKGFKFAADASLPVIDSVLWGAPDYLCGEGAALSPEDQQVMKIAYELIQEVIDRQLAENEPQPIHADMHGWNLMWHEGKLAVFDFDDAMMGTPLIDLATAIYYLDTEEQNQSFIDGYRSITPLAPHSPRDLEVLLVQRRIVLLNYLFETSNPEHQAIIPDYQAETMRRVKALVP
jgi:Ser/Thr protein kinase RdoA (MazF antagonist)